MSNLPVADALAHAQTATEGTQGQPLDVVQLATIAADAATAAARKATEGAGAKNAGGFMELFLELFKILLPILLELLKGNNAESQG